MGLCFHFDAIIIVSIKKMLELVKNNKSEADFYKKNAKNK